MIRNLLLLVAVSAAWTAGNLFIGEADRSIPPVTGAAVMALVAAAVMLPWVGLRTGRELFAPLRRRPLVPLVMGFTAIALPNLASVIAERTITADLSSVLGTTVPILTLLLTTFVTREVPVSASRLGGVVVALVGLVLFVGWRDLLNDRAELAGILVMMSGGLVFALNGLFADRQTRDLDDRTLATWTIVFGAVALLVAAFTVEAPLSLRWSWPMVWPLLAEGVLGMGFAYLGYYALVARSGATFASLYAFLVPPLGVLAGVAFLGHRLTLQHTAGLGVLLVGLYLLTRPATVDG